MQHTIKDTTTAVKQIFNTNLNKYKNQINCNIAHAVICPSKVQC